MGILTIEALKKELVLNVIGNGTDKITLEATYPAFDPTFDATLSYDLLITCEQGFTSGEIIVIMGSTSGSFPVSSTQKAIWLSELTGVTRPLLNANVTETIAFNLASNKLLDFKLVSAKAVDFLSADLVYTNGFDGTAMTLFGEMKPQMQDESNVGAIGHAINNSTTVITGNETNIITITNTYPVFGTALSKTMVIDNAITFSEIVPMNTEIFVKKDGISVATYITKANLRKIYLSEILGISRELLYTKKTEIYELSFVFKHTINNQLLIGEPANFTFINIVSNRIGQGLYELADSKTLDVILVDTNDCNFVITYEDYNKTIKSAIWDLGNNQTVDVSIIMDNSIIPPKALVKLSNIDISSGKQIDLIMDKLSMDDYITLMRDFSRQISKLNTIQLTK